jgi:OFA family oxalate/formate antiporter-like MFS transporter
LVTGPKLDYQGSRGPWFSADSGLHHAAGIATVTEASSEMSKIRWKKGAVSAGLAATVALIFSAPSLFISSFALFLKPVSAELNWNAAIFPESLLVVSILYAIIGPIAGGASDRFGAKYIVVGGVVLLAIGLFGLAMMSGSVLQLIAFAIVLGISAPMVSPPTIAPVVAAWFADGRGLIMGLILGAAPQMAVAAFSPVISQAIEQFGWRSTYRILAVVALAICIPVTALFLRDPPGGGGPGGAAQTRVPASGLTLREALRTRALWLMFGASAALALIFGAVSGHIVAWLADQGMSAAFSAKALSAMFIGGVIGPIISGACSDRILRPQILAPFVAAPLLGLGLLLVPGNPAVTLAGAALVGLGFSAWVGQTSVLVTRNFGLRSTGELSGVMISAGAIMLGLGPVLLGIARTLTGNYEAAIIAFMVVAAIPPLCVLLLPPYPAEYVASAVTQNTVGDTHPV